MSLTTESADHVNVVKSWAEYLAPTSFPAVLEIGMRVTHLGRSSVDYEFSVFQRGVDMVCVVGGHRLVSVDSTSRRSREWSAHMRHGFETIFNGVLNADGKAKL
jgi:acyl-CoA thioester hydrolase